VDPRAYLEAVAKRKIPPLDLPGNEPRSFSPSLVTILTEPPRLQKHVKYMNLALLQDLLSMAVIVCLGILIYKRTLH
jgi:hypothetical protein